MSDQIPTSEQIRANIDSGRTGEKVAFPDPAAAPLGTDDEAAGQSPTPSERRLEAETRPVHHDRQHDRGIVVYLGLVAMVSVAILAIAATA